MGDGDGGGDVDGLVRRFPLGGLVRGRVRDHLVLPGRAAAGVRVDLGGLPVGFVDAGHLPREAQRWPRPGARTGFEVLRHDVRRSGRLQIRLLPLEADFRGPLSAHRAHDDDQWRRIGERHPVGSQVTGTVTSVRPCHRWFTVAFDGTWGRVTCPGDPPAVGEVLRLRVARLPGATRRVVLVRTDGGGPGAPVPRAEH
ncbi:hypothetical protein [Kitasatospora sp. NPDC101183]|uniref:hypothetical protein n=1 Tax=Kitasatospora sp. NPDC101183 TaxID=3364100 RepID=UPI00382F4B38